VLLAKNLGLSSLYPTAGVQDDGPKGSGISPLPVARRGLV